jgi:hypothetical protein
MQRMLTFMQNKRVIFAISVLFLAVVFGAGCWKKEAAAPPADNEDSFASMDAEQAARAVTFKNGSYLVILQTGVAFEGRFYTGDSAKSTRYAELSMFGPGRAAELIWQLEELIETDESMEARAAFKRGEHEEGAEEPVRKYGQIITSGKLSAIDLDKSHELSLPVRWKPEEDKANSAAIWASADVFSELSRTRNSTVYLDAIDSASQAVSGDEKLESAISALRDHIRSISDRTDVDFMKVGGDAVDWPLTVNGERVNVRAIKARNWFGEIVVLDNPGNPLILKFEFNPNVEGMEAGSEEMNILRGLLGFEVAEVTL